MKSVIDFKKHPYNGVGFTSTPELLTALTELTKIGYIITDDHSVRAKDGASRCQILRDVRDAIVHSPVKIRDDDFTKDGQYRSDWIVLDHYALRICAFRVGGYGAILEARETFDKEKARHVALLPAFEKRDMLRKQGLAKLTQEERNALGV